MYLPSVTPSEAHEVYSRLHVTSAAFRLERTYDTLYFVAVFFHIVVRCAFLAVGLSVAFRKLADTVSSAASPLDRKLMAALRRIPGRNYFERWNLQLFRSVFVYYLLYAALFTAFWLPFGYKYGYVLPHRYGLSHESLVAWCVDTLKDASVDGLIGALCAGVIVCGISVYPKRWAFVFALWSAPIVLCGIFLDPLLDQVDNRFTPLPVSSPLYAPLHNLALRAGVPNVTILVADKSRQTEETNAYVTGMGSSARIVLWDTLIAKMPTDEVVAITGHEMGHYVEHHVIFGGLAAALAMFLYLPALKWIAEWMLASFGRKWKITSLADPAAIPILIVALSILSFLTSPITNFASRIIEHRADSYGLAITGNRLAMANALVDLSNQNLSDPYPPKWEIFWLQDHPPFGERIRFALYGQPVSPWKYLK